MFFFFYSVTGIINTFMLWVNITIQLLIKNEFIEFIQNKLKLKKWTICMVVYVRSKNTNATV